MTRYTYVLKADQQKSGYGGTWLDLDRAVTVTAGDYAEATQKALSALPAPRRDTGGWSFFTVSITEIEETPVSAEHHECPPAREVRRFRKTGAR